MKNTRILIVEDSLIVSFHLHKTLENEGYRLISQVDSAERAIEMAMNFRPHLILMDVMLKGTMDGVDAARIIKEKYDIPIVFITALSDKGTINRAKLAEPYGFLTKPFEDREIFTVVEMALYKHWMESKLKRSEELYFKTLSSISDAVLAVDKEYNIIFINSIAEKLMGISATAALNQPLFEVFYVKNNTTGEYINPLQSVIHQNGAKINSMQENLVIISLDGKETPIGGGTVNSIEAESGALSGLSITFRDFTANNQLVKLKELAELNRISSLIKGQEMERSRIAKDLHDGIGQMLNVIKINVRGLVDNQEKAKDIGNLLEEAITEIKRISDNLVPSKLRDFDLPVSIRSLCAQFEGGSGISISLTDWGNFNNLAETVKINLFRIVQEAITNSIKHSQCTSINIQLNSSFDKIELTIEDDGSGFSKLGINDGSHHGVINMRERAQILGGKFEIETASNRGTVVMVEVPIIQENEI